MLEIQWSAAGVFYIGAMVGKTFKVAISLARSFTDAQLVVDGLLAQWCAEDFHPRHTDTPALLSGQQVVINTAVDHNGLKIIIEPA